MPNLTFYIQTREDGGRRTGIEIADLTAFELFEPGVEEEDPALSWWVDLRCLGASLPDTREGALQWFLENGPAIQEGFRTLADRLAAGVDLHHDPLQWRVPQAPEGVEMTIVCSAIRRRVALELPRILADIAAHWDEQVRKLPAAYPVTA